jgi:hypothetical protein
MPETETESYLARLVELSGGQVQGEPLEKLFRGFPTDRFRE